MEQICKIHNKPLKENARGHYCSTPMKKDDKGNVLEWCPTKISKPKESYAPKVGNDDILAVLLEIRSMLTQYFRNGSVSLAEAKMAPKLDKQVDDANAELEAARAAELNNLPS